MFVMGFRNKLDTEPVHSVTKDTSVAMLKNKADLSQQFASFCSLLKLSSYNRHKWYLYPPIMPQVLGRPIVALYHFSLYYAESAICSTCSHTSNDRNVSVCYQTLTLRGGLGTRLWGPMQGRSPGRMSAATPHHTQTKVSCVRPHT